MAIVEFSAPGKTFILGEYLAVKGGPSLVLTTEPRFRLRVSPSPASELIHIHELSPAGLWFQKKKESFAGWRIEFLDPHKGVGGLGASSAQFALLYVSELFLREGHLDFQKLQWPQILSDYRSVAWNGQGEAPSGADVVAQLCGGFTHYDGFAQKARVLKWPFADAGLVLLHTGRKLATHEYLQAKLEVPEREWRKILLKAEQALEEAQLDLFTEAFQEYGAGLHAQGWVAQSTQEILAQLALAPHNDFEILASKGCGAMGVDIVALLYRSTPNTTAGSAPTPAQVAEKIESWLLTQSQLEGVRVVGHTCAISAGLRIEEIAI
jgi:mevalonate kinase